MMTMTTRFKTLLILLLAASPAWSAERIRTPVAQTVSFKDNLYLKELTFVANLEFDFPERAGEPEAQLLLKNAEIQLLRPNGSKLVLRPEIAARIEVNTQTECSFRVKRLHLSITNLIATPGQLPEWVLRKIRGILDDMETTDHFALRQFLESALNSKIEQALYLCNSEVTPADFRKNPNQLTLETIQALDTEVHRSWLDRFGFMRLKPLGPAAELDNENPVLFTSEYVFLLKHLGFLRGDLRQNTLSWIRTIIDPIRIRRTADGSTVRGLFNRRPGDFSRVFSHDEQIGLIALDWAFERELGFCQELYEYGSAHDWRFSNQTFEGRAAKNTAGKPISVEEAEMNSWRGPGFRGLVQACLGKDINYAGRLQAAMTHGLSTGKKSGTSGKILSLLTLEVIKDSSEFIRTLRAKYHQELRRTYGLDNPYDTILSEYFLGNSPDRPHPIIRLGHALELDF